MKRLAGNLALAALSSALGLGGLEGLCRLLETRHVRPARADYIWDWQDKWQSDFYTIRSEAVGWPPWEEINGDGLRDRSHPVEKPEGVLRLVVLGDSVTLGDGIEPAQAFPQQLQAALDAEGRPVEVFNVALWGWSTRQERLAYQRLARRYRPDEVLLAVCLNDIPELQNNLARPPAWLASAHAASALVRAVVNAEGREIGDVEQLFTEAGSSRVEEAFARFEEEVRALRREVAADGARFAVLVFPFRFQVEPDAPAPRAQQRILGFCEREGLRCLDLLPALRPLGAGGFVDYDHLSPEGAARTAEALRQADLVAWPESHAAVAAGRDPGTLLRDPDARRRAAAAHLLGSVPEAAPLLASALSDPAPSVRAAAARSLGAVGREAATRAALFEALRDGSENVRWEAARALDRLRLTADEVPALARALRNDDAYVRGFAAFTLGNLGPAAAAAVPALVEALDREDGYGRGGASAALGKIGPAAAAAVPTLVRGLHHADGERRWKAARTLGRLGPAAAAAVPDLSAALKDPHELVRQHAARALGRMGTAAGSASEALAAAAREDADPAVRKDARKALESLATR